MKKKTLFLNICMLITTICMTPIILKCSDHTETDMSLAFTPEQIALMGAINTAIQQTIAEMQTHTHNVPPFQNNRKDDDDDDETASYMSSNFSAIDDDKDTSANQENPLQCPDCLQIFKYRQGLSRHKIAVHTSTKGHPCPICSKNISRKNDIPRHIDAMHSTIKRHQCHICPATFNDRSCLRRHLRTHTGEKPYPCTYPGCNKQFSENGNLSRHLRIHTGEKPYSCEKCSRKFGDASHYNYHKKRCK